MLKSKKLVAFLLAGILTVSAFAGCSPAPKDDVQAPSTGDSDVSTPASVEEEKLEPVELSWRVIGTPQDDQQTITDAVNAVLKEKLNATLKIEVIDWGSFDEKMKVAIATSEEFDMCYTSSWANPYASNASKGAFLALDELLPEYGKNIMEQVPESYWDAVKVSGKTYAVINYQINAVLSGYSFPKDMAEKYKLDTASIKKMADLEPYLEQIKKGEPDKTPLLVTGGIVNMPMLCNVETGLTMDYIAGNSSNPLAIRVDDKDSKVFNAIESPEFMDLCKLAKSWYEKGYVRKDTASITDSKAEVKTGKYAAFGTGVGPGSVEVEGANAGFPIVQAQTVPTYINTGTIQSALTAISRTSKNPERAMMVLDLLFADKDLYNTLCYGIKDKHYTEVTATTIDPLADGGYNPGIAWCYGSWFNAKLLKGQPEDLWDQLKEINGTANSSPILGFLYSTDSTKNENAEIAAIMSEYLTGLLTGTIDPVVKVPELVEKLNKAGMPKVIEDAQKQIDDWKVSNAG